MAIITTADRVRETTNTTGTGTLSLDGAVSNYQSFIDGVGDGSVITYCIIHRNSNEWEVGYGTITNATPDTLSRIYISFSSNSGSIVNLSSGTKDVFITHSSEFVVTKNTDGKINVEDGGTNISSYSSGDLIYASGATALSKLSAASAGNALLSGTSPSWGKITSSHVDSSISLAGHTHAHSTITGLTSGDDHTQYALLAGRSGGQVFYGSTLASENLDLHSTSHGTKGLIRFRGNVSGGNGSSFDFLADVTGTNVSRMRFTSGNIIVGNNLDIFDGASSVFTIEGAENDSTGSATIASLAFANDSNRSSQTSDPIAQISASVADLSVGPNLGQLDFYTKDGTTLLKRATITKDGRFGIGTIPTATLHLQAGGTAANSAPFKFTSGSLLTTPEAGAIEFRTDAFYGTITTGAARRTFAFLESPVFTTPTLGVASATSLTSTIVYGGTGSGGNLSLTSTTHATKGNVVFNGFSYVSPTGVFFGDMNGTLTGNVVGSVTGSSGSCTGNAATATVLQTTRTIGGSSFNGSANVTSFPAPGAIGGTTPSTIAATSLACPTFTSAAAMGFTPAAGSGFNVTLSGAGDFLINSTQFVVDVSTGNVGVNNASPAYKFDLTGGQRIVGSLVVSDAGEMVTNGTFASNITGWTDSSTGVESIAWNAGGWMDLFSTGAGYARADQQLVTVPGVRYKVTFTAGGTLTYTGAVIGTTQGGYDLLYQTYPLPAGSNVYYFTATSTSSWLRFDNGGGTSTIDNVSVTSGNATFAGNVCIGNTTGTLHVNRGSAGSVASSAYATITQESSDGTANDFQYLSPNTAQQRILFGDVDDNDVGMIRYIHSNNSLDIITNTAVAVNINSTQDVGIGASAATAQKLLVSKTNAANTTGIGIKSTLISSATSNGSYYGIALDFDLSNMSISTSITDSGYRAGVRGDAYAGTANFLGTLAAQYGVWGRAGISVCGTGGTVTNAYGLRSDILNDHASGTITNAYGLYIDNSRTTGTITNRWGVYVDTGSLGKNYFSNNVGIAITAPTALMHLGASTTARAPLCIPAGTAPTSPVTGDIWYDGTNLKFRDGGTTRTLTWV